MNRIKLKEKVVKLRGQSKTYSEIQQQLNTTIPKSTLSYWCKNVKLPKEYYEKIKKINLESTKKGRATKQVKRKKLFNALRVKNEHLVKHLNEDTCKLMLGMLYLGEGKKYRRKGRMLGLANADPKVIKLYLKFLYKCFPIDKKKFRATVMCRADQDTKQLEKYWQSVTTIPFSQFYKTRIDKRTIGKKTKRKDYKGVCDIYYFDTKIQIELELLAQQVMQWI